ncbi:Tissue inhibitor of metalloproteinase [compost metagenome]
MIYGRTILLLFTFLIVVEGLVSYAGEAYACSCASSITMQERFDSSHAVFAGTAVSVESTSMPLFRSSAKAVKAAFKVNEVWKGQVTSTIEVITPEYSDSCGYEFEVGERYLVYAQADGKALNVNLCNGTVIHAKAGEQLAALGSGSVPPQTVEAEESVLDKIPVIVLLLLFLISLMAVLIYFIRRKRLRSGT